MHGTRRTLAVLLIAGAMAIGCDTGTAPPNPAEPSTPPPTGTPIALTATASPVQTSAAPAPAPVATPAPAPSATPGTLPPPDDSPLSAPCDRDSAAPSAAAASLNSFRWTHRSRTSRADLSDEVRLFRTSRGWLTRHYSSLQFSPDLRVWTTVHLAGVGEADYFAIDAIAATPDAQVVIGTVDHEDPSPGVWGSTEVVAFASHDGLAWEPITDPDIAGIRAGVGGSNGCNLVLAGSSSDGTPMIWTSADGLAWTTSTDPDARQVATGVTDFATGPGVVLAIVMARAGIGGPRRGEVWRSMDGLEWERLGPLPGSAKLRVSRTAYGNGRWLILGFGRKWAEYTWSSADGVTWERIRRRHVVGVTDVAGYEKGFIATGYHGDFPGDTCGSGAPYIGRTWVTNDGVTWTEVGRTRGVSMVALAPLDGRLYGIGLTSGYRGRTWWGRLPGVESAHGPATLGPLPPGTGGCGP